MNLHALYHRSKSNYCYCYDQKRVHIRFRAAKQELSQVVLIYGDKYKWEGRKEKLMELVCSDELFDYFAAEVEPEHNRLAYIFELYKDKEKLYYTEIGALEKINERELYQQFFQYPYIHKAEVHITPEWAKDAVFYQIFPERFYNGNPAKPSEKLCSWDSKPEAVSFFGGDLKGIIEKLSYIEELGINAIYMTPIFEAPSNHKYDTSDYFKIDPQFGDLETLKELVRKCHQKGIRVILDAVFNHSGYLFKPFQDVISKGPESDYYNWFHIHKWPFEVGEPSYDAFAFADYMPKLNTENPEVREYLLKAARYWIEEADIDGWRLDVSDEVDHSFWRAFRKAVKSVKPDAYIVGENWLGSLPWLMGDQFDAVMNYPFTRSCIKFFAERSITETQFKNCISSIQMKQTQQVNEVMLNLLDSHDTARFLTISGGSRDSLKLAAAFQFTYMGAPCVYYGTEIGMEGAGDPDCRRAMQWEESKWDKELLQHYRSLIKLRKCSEALRRGSFRWVECEEGLLAFERISDNEKALIIINNKDYEQGFELSSDYFGARDGLKGEPININQDNRVLQLAGQSFQIMILQQNNV